MAGSQVAVASEWAERPRVLTLAGIDRANVSLLEAGTGTRDALTAAMNSGMKSLLEPVSKPIPP